ncbi:MAG: histidine phosphatase family protein [Pseudanabaenaceae cyanobacterium SKYGB_i_bin29]|nr:histidine phosphatase family protein [Pseudanabaenaceae cyanobacterium SKYG29]MDW8422647.1 histidine phosphatase family protein [Pseudanabaenaceae cyanobacterium SKYGB_i_bin29]
MRHGESTSNLQGLVQGRGFLDDPARQSALTEKGVNQALAVGKALLDIEIDYMLVSPLKRAQQTAELINSLRSYPLPTTTVANLCEIDLPGWEGVSFEEVKRTSPDRYHCWHNTPHLLEMQGKYPVLDLFAQAQAFWQELLPSYQGKTVLCIGHSGINRALIFTALGITPDRYHCLSQGNCCVSVINFKPDGTAQLESANLTQHHNHILYPLRSGWTGPRILLVRHGETQWNREQRFQGQIDVPLNQTGLAQAQKTAEFLRSVKIDRAFASPLLRPKQTAEAILAGRDVPLTLLDDLKEISHGLWEGKLETEIAQEFPGELERWQREPQNVQMPQGENLQQVWQRAKRAWQEIITVSQPGETVLVVGHDAINKALLCQLFDLKPDRFWAFKQGNGGISVVDFREGKESAPVLTTANITFHLSGSILDTTAKGAL